MSDLSWNAQYESLKAAEGRVEKLPLEQFSWMRFYHRVVLSLIGKASDADFTAALDYAAKAAAEDKQKAAPGVPA